MEDSALGQSVALDYLLAKHRADREKLALQEPPWERQVSALSDSGSDFRKAERIVEGLKEQEVSRLHEIEPVASDGHGHVHQFMRAKGMIGESSLSQILKNMPKGALLHCHLEAMLSPAGLLEQARSRPNLYIKTSVALCSQSDYEGLVPCPQVCVLPSNDSAVGKETSIFSANYDPGSWMLWSQFLKVFPGGAHAAEAWLISKIVLSVQDVYKPSQTINGIWQVFIQSFQVIWGFIYYESAWRYLWQSIIRSLVAENIQYAEVRFVLARGNNVISDDGSRKLSYIEMLDIIQGCSLEGQRRSKGTGEVFHGLKIIYTMLRRCENDEMEWAMDNCISLKQAFPDLICGFDMVGQEDAGYSLNHWLPQLLQMQLKCQNLGIDIPFLFHAGETHNTGGDAESNVHDAVLLGSRRIGHGFQLGKHPVLQQICRDKHIAIEVCPISHEVLGLCSRIATHPIQQLLASGVPCVIGSDDPGFWKSNLLSDDFYQILTRIPKMTLRGLYTMIHWSIEHSMTTREEKEVREATFEKQWADFCKQIVRDYAKHT